MTRRDIPQGMRLRELAGWNQTEQDWELFLSANPQGCFVAEMDGGVVGTVATIIYENRFAWIGMVLVDPEFRKRGIGSALLQQAIEHLDSRGIACMRLDATPQGKPVYLKLGFLSEYEIERWNLKRSVKHIEPGRASGQLEDVLKLDREVFGADRTAVLRVISQSAPEFVQVATAPADLAAKGNLTAKANLTGYALGRHGSHSDHLGPWIAYEEDAAADLLAGFLSRSSRESVVVDCLAANSWARGLLQASGFEFARPLTRMYRGDNRYPGRPEAICAVVGPEFG
jgi:GNAT superfamily N-acetyltransferase